VAAPSGLVTLLFTDIEGSTRAWEAHPAEMQVALERHDKIVRARIEDAGGYVFKTAGDAFCAAFAESTDAISAAVEVQEALAAEPWPEQVPIRVRIGLHSGVCQQRDGDYFGPPLNRVARLLGTAHGGQVVISGATAGLIAGDLAPGLSLLDLGEHRLRDLGEPERIYQVCGAELLCNFPPLRSLDSPELIHNLPSQASSFIGRDVELDQLRGVLEESRVVTLTGSGGVGKTRLALQLAADALDGSGDGVWFVDLAPLQDPALVAATTAGVLGVHEEPGRSAQESLVAALRSRKMLVVFDNCEHVIDEAASLVDTLTGRCPQLAILATSREPLRIPGEHVYRVPSLSAPARDEDDPDIVIGSDAVRLFLERAANQQSGVSLDAQNAAVVARLCRRLDGIPLAIELAVARLRSLSLTDLDRRLDQRLRLLIGGSRTALPRHQTLEALIGWSYDMLSPLEQELLDRLSVFAGGFDLDAADAVVRSRTQSSLGILDRLAALVDKSLVETDRTAKLRYRLLESIRQYAAAKLLVRGEDVARGVRGAHRDYYLALAETAAPRLIGHGQREWLDRLERELGNLRTALMCCLEDPDPAPGLRLNTALCDFWLYRGSGIEAPSAACAALDRPDAQQPTVIRGRTLVAAAELLTSIALEHHAATARAEEGIGIAEAEADEHSRCKALSALAWISVRRGEDDRVLELTEEGLDVARVLGDEHLTAELLNVRASSPSLTPQERLWMCEECLGLFRQVGDQIACSRVLGNLAYLEMAAGEYPAACRRLHEAIGLLRELDDPRGLTVCMCNLGFSQFLDGMTDDAEASFDEMLRISRRIGDLGMIAYGQLGLAILTSRNGDPEAAAELHGAADAIHETLGTRVEGVESTVREADIADLRLRLGDAAFEAAYGLGRARRADAIPAAV
jgi:predicted ATPase/class 3 adenylate cyclase